MEVTEEDGNAAVLEPIVHIKSEESPNGTTFDNDEDLCSNHSSDSEPLISRFSKRQNQVKSRSKSSVKKLANVRKRKRKEDETLKKEPIPIPDVFIKGKCQDFFS